MLDQYLKQDNSDDRSIIRTADSGSVPLETPYYPNSPSSSGSPSSDQTAAQQRTGAEQSQPDTQNQPQDPQQNAQPESRYNDQYGQGGEYDQGSRFTQSGGQGAQYNRGAMPDNRGYQDPGGSEGTSAPYYTNNASANYGGNNNYNNNYNGSNNNYGGNNYGANNSYGGSGYGGDPGYRQDTPVNYNVSRINNGGNGGVMPASHNNGAPEQTTVISKQTIISGDVQSFDNLHIDGSIKGNVETTKNVDLSGKVVGDMVCNNAGLTSAAMQGNISLKGRMLMDRDTILIGDVSSQYADINGKVRGKLDIVGKVEIKHDAIVFGDINASSISVIDGAIIQGYVNTTYLSPEDGRKAFPEAISIEGRNNSSNNG